MGPMTSLRFGRAQSSIGPVWLAETDAGLAAVSRAESPGPILDGLRRRFPSADVEPAEMSPDRLHQTLDLRGLPAFDAAVYRVVAAIPAGDTLTYGDVAAIAGSPGAARAAGNAMARCPLFPAVPCHRVVRASDGWSGWGGDVTLKRQLLESERRAVSSRGPR
jgi:AraC family transcriptional regulator of adaptative response/methylated-DNA-[protein]-cysteine methyltransferase